MFQILTPDTYVTSPWKNGGGITHEIAKAETAQGWRWRLSIAEVATDGPFSRYDGMSRILTVIEGNGIDLHTPEGILQARPCKPVAFSGELPIDSRMVDGPIKDLNLIYDARLLRAEVVVLDGPCQMSIGPGWAGFLCLAGEVSVDKTPLPAMAFALADTGGVGEITLADGARGVLIRLLDLV